MARKKAVEVSHAKSNNSATSGVKKRKSERSNDSLSKKLKAKKEEKASGLSTIILHIIRHISLMRMGMSVARNVL